MTEGDDDRDGESFSCPQCFCLNPLVPLGGRAAPSVVKELEGRESNEKLLRCLVEATVQGAAVLDSVRETLQSVLYPFDHVEEGITVSKYLIQTLPPPDYPGAVDGALSYAANEGLKVSARSVGRLCVIAETTETALGLPLGEAPSVNKGS